MDLQRWDTIDTTTDRHDETRREGSLVWSDRPSASAGESGEWRDSLIEYERGQDDRH